MPGAVFLEGDEINLRTVEEEDLEFIRDTYNLPEVRKYMSHFKPANLEQEKDFFQNVVCSDEEVNLAICVDDEIIGLISLIEKDADSAVEIGLWIHPNYHGNGYGTEASELMIDYGFRELALHKVIARAYESNKGSQRIWEKLGFEKEGELREQIYAEGDYEDVYYYGFLEDEWEYER